MSTVGICNCKNCVSSFAPVKVEKPSNPQADRVRLQNDLYILEQRHKAGEISDLEYKLQKAILIGNQVKIEPPICTAKSKKLNCVA